MHVLWGLLMVVIGVFFVICGTIQSEFIIYRICVLRAKTLWGDNVHRFFQYSGTMIIIIGILLAMGLF